MKIILASASPRRRELFNIFGLPFECVISGFDETTLKNEKDPKRFAVKSAIAKAKAVAIDYDNAVVISADTVVSIGRSILGKPLDNNDARRMLKNLSGKCHNVTTGVCVLLRKNGKTVKLITAAPVSYVRFKVLSDDIINAYVNTGEPSDKAGAYGIQGLGGLLVESINGCYFNIVGLPIEKLGAILASIGLPVVLLNNSNTLHV